MQASDKVGTRIADCYVVLGDLGALAKLEAKPWNGNTATRLATSVIVLGAFLGKPVDAPITHFLNRFVFADPPALTHGVTTMFGVLAVCTQSKGAEATRCLERIASLYDREWFGGAVLSGKDGIDGTRRHLQGDFAGAAKAWRPVANELLADIMRGPMVAAFDRAGDTELAHHLDEQPVAANLELARDMGSLLGPRGAPRGKTRGPAAGAEARAHVRRSLADGRRDPAGHRRNEARAREDKVS